MLDTIDNVQLWLPRQWAVHAQFRRNKTAVICGDRRLTWEEMNQGMNRIANALLARGAGRGTKVAVLMSNSIEMLLVMGGIAKAGACMVPLSTMLKPDQIAMLLNDSGSEMVFVSASARGLVEDRAKLTSVRKDGFISTDFSDDGWETLEAFTAGASAEEPKVAYDLDDDFNIIYSSGTTGIPKGIVHSHRARQHWSYSNAVEMGIDDRAVCLVTTALYSNGTWFMVLPPLMAGATIIIMKSFSPGEFLETVERERVTHTFVVPAQCIMMLEHPDCGKRDLSSLRMMLSAGSSLRLDTREQVEARLTPNLYELYGFSEGFATIVKPGQSENKPGTVGRPVLGFDMVILDDKGNVLPAGEPGEIAGWGPGLMTRYHNRPEQTAELIWRDPLGRSFLRGGDVGKVDEDGFLYILDRKKDMIISGGFNIFPTDIEEVVGRHPDVLDVTVIGVPHPKWDETPLALVIPRDPAKADAEAILTWANERLAKTQRLSGVEFRSEFPRNALGKVLKRELREPYWQGKK